MICHGILSFQTHCKRFNQDCSKIYSSLQQQAAAAASASAAVAAAAAAATSAPNLRRQILRPLQMPLVRRSHKFGITVLVHLEAAWKER
jgi:3-oxoacyl-ACP reductase-like protein